MSLFQNSVLNKYLKGLETEKVKEAYEKFTRHFHNTEIQENIRNSKEEQYQGEFLIDLFVNVLGYIKNPTPDFNLTTELKNIKDSKKTDGAILNGEKALAVIELKGTNTTDLSKVETQAFGYKNNQPGCNYVITSNFEKLRFYIDNAVDFEEFNLFKLTKERFDILWLCLSSDYLLKNTPKKIKDESLSQEENISKKLYNDYSKFRSEIFASIQKENPEYDKLTLFKKTQKLLDRFLFIFFAEDRLLLPPNSIRSIVNQWADLRDKYDEYFPLYDRFKKYFAYMNTGHKGQQHDIFAYNGGLFAPDEILDNIKINDDILYKHTVNLSNYDFESEVGVNILGHIFEHSLNDIDEIQAEIQGVATEQSKTKRKKDGVFYTPKYITKYIVENTIGKLCEEKKTELDIQEAEYEKERKGRQKATLKKLIQKLDDYRKWLLQITICDPACGSGAFLNQALEFLIAEHRYIDELQAKLFGDAMVLSEVENSILENNLFGVDINEESVEIAKLSLWLRTAQKGRKLTTLNNNIKCGNSLIDDPKVAGEKAFNWQKEFPDVFAKGGFDVVIGNPPYVRPHNIKDADKVFLWNKYFVASQKTDLYAFFTEKGALILNKDGILGYIMPKTWMSIHSFLKLRQFILENYNINQIGLLPSKVFDDATVETAIIIFDNKPAINEFNFISVIENNVVKTEKQSDILLINNLNINENVQKSLSEFKYLGDITDIIVGIATGDDKKYCRFEKLTELDKPAIRGANISRYNINYTGEFLWYDRDQIIFDGNNKPKSSLKMAVGQSSPKKPSDFEMPEKIVMQRISKKIIASIDTEQYYAHTSVVILKPKADNIFKNKYVLAILNSSYINYWLKTNSSNVSINVSTVKNIPIKILPIENQINYESKVNLLLVLNKELQLQSNKFIKLVQSKYTIEKLTTKLKNWYYLEFSDFLKELKKQKIQLSLSEEAEWMQYFKEQKEKAQILKAEIDKTDKEIDQMVYELYGLTEEEIKIVEEATA